LQVSGVFDADRAETVLALLPEILPVQVHTAAMAACICAPAIECHTEGGLRVVPSGRCLNPSEGPRMTRPVPPAALRRLAPALLAACLCAALPATAQTAASAPVELHLPAGPLQASLVALARQSGIQLLFAADSVSGRSARHWMAATPA
jgi:ferric-dicitrate binding protein FerR (iron transport regulator)